MGLFDSCILRSNFYWILYFSLLPQPDVFEIVKDKFYVIYTEMISMLTEYFIKRGVEDPEAEAVILGSLLDGVYMHYILNPDHFPLEAVKKKLIQIYCKK